MVSPGTIPVASTLRRLAEVPVDPSPIETVPEVIEQQGDGQGQPVAGGEAVEVHGDRDRPFAPPS
jgi:hypothetical protein